MNSYCPSDHLWRQTTVNVNIGPFNGLLLAHRVCSNIGYLSETLLKLFLNLNDLTRFEFCLDIFRCNQYWITNTKQVCMGYDAICVPYLLLLLPSGFDLITEPEVLIGVCSRAHPVCDRAALSVNREITLTQPPLRAPKPGITSQPQPASQLNIGTQLTSREQTWHQSHAVAWFLNFASYNLKYTEKHSAKEQHFQLSWLLRF